MGTIYQFAATSAWPFTWTFLDLGLLRTLLIEDRFFFFCNSRPMLEVVDCRMEYDFVG